MAVITDVGDEADIHPKQKEPVGRRLALAARALVYGQDVEYSGPEYHRMKREGTKVILSFKHVGKGLKSEGGLLRGFAIAGADRKWVNAQAEIRGTRWWCGATRWRSRCRCGTAGPTSPPATVERGRPPRLSPSARMTSR
jgi:hypothetical protein